jgi:hypothetical protein
MTADITLTLSPTEVEALVEALEGYPWGYPTGPGETRVHWPDFLDRIRAAAGMGPTPDWMREEYEHPGRSLAERLRALQR